MDVKKNRSLRFLLVVAVLVSMFSTTAFAAEDHAGVAAGKVASVADQQAAVYPVTSITVNQPYKEGSTWYVDVVIYGNPDSV